MRAWLKYLRDSGLVLFSIATLFAGALIFAAVVKWAWQMIFGG